MTDTLRKCIKNGEFPTEALAREAIKELSGPNTVSWTTKKPRREFQYPL